MKGNRRTQKPFIDETDLVHNNNTKLDNSRGMEVPMQEEQTFADILIQNIGDVIAILGTDGITKYQSPNIEKWFGWKSEDLIGKKCWEQVHPDDVERIQNEFFKILENEKGSTVEFRFKCIDGNYRWIELTAANRINMPEINGVLLNYHDITERKKHETALLESEALYHSLFEASADGIQIVDVATKMLKYANPAMCRMLGYTSKELETLRIEDMHPKEDLQRIMTEIRGNKTRASNIPCLRKDGSIIYTDIHRAQIIIDDRPCNMGIFRDITERKLVDDKLRDSEERLKILFNYAPDAYYLNDLKGNFVDGNVAAQKLLGFDKNELIGKNFLTLNIITPRQILKASKLLAKNLIGQSTGPDEFELTRKDKSTVSVEVSTHPIRIKDHTVVLGIARDITERKRAEHLLQETNARHASMIENLGDVIAIIGVDGMTKYQSPNIEKWFGWKPEDLIGTNGWDKMHPDDIERIQNEFNNMLQKETASKVEYRFKCKDGQYKWIELTAVNRINDSVINGVLLNYHDITERKQVEAALNESEVRYRSLYEASADGIQMVDLETKMLKHSNPALCRMLGYSAEELSQLRVEDIHPEKDMEWIIAEFESVARGDKTLASDIPCLRKDGTIVYADIHSANTIIDNRPCNMGIFRDITERKRSEETLRYERTLLRLLIDNVPDLMYTKDRTCCKTLVNKADLKNIGAKSESEVLGKDDFAFFSKEKAEQFYADDLSVIQTGQPIINKEESFLNESGQKKWVLTSKLPLRDENGQIIGLAGIGRNITERKRMEEEIRKLSFRDELTGLYNRRGFITLGEQEINLEARRKKRALMFFADLDGMKWINDTLGHKEGDKALIKAASIFKKTFRSSDIIARLGGDEFAILAIDPKEIDPKNIISRFQNRIDTYNDQTDSKYKLSISIGSSFYDPENPSSIYELMAGADKLMYDQKKNRKR